MISFKASYVSSSFVERKAPNGNWIKEPVNLVKLDPHDGNDIAACREIAGDWYALSDGKAGATLARNMYKDLSAELRPPLYDYYVLTTQNNFTAPLRSGDILGFAEINPKSSYKGASEIIYLQTKPTCNYFTKNRTIQNVGRVIMKQIENIFNNREICLEPSIKAVEFYEKLGYVRDVMSRYMSKRV